MKAEDCPLPASSSEPSHANDHTLDAKQKRAVDRRSFLKKAGTASVALSAGSLLSADLFAQSPSSSITKGDAAILRFLAAAEILETDLWQQYAELGGKQDKELRGLTGGSPLYTLALGQLDEDMDQYIHDNTEDELTHELFINAYLMSKGAEPVSLRRIPYASEQQGYGGAADRASHEPDAAFRGHDLVYSLPGSPEESGPWRQIPTGDPEPGCRRAYGDPAH